MIVTEKLGVSSSLLYTGSKPISQSSDSTSSSISTGAIVGIVVGGVIGLALIVTLLLCMYRYTAERTPSPPPSDTTIQMSNLGGQIEIHSLPLPPKAP